MARRPLTRAECDAILHDDSVVGNRLPDVTFTAPGSQSITLQTPVVEHAGDGWYRFRGNRIMPNGHIQDAETTIERNMVVGSSDEDETNDMLEERASREEPDFLRDIVRNAFVNTPLPPNLQPEIVPDDRVAQGGKRKSKRRTNKKSNRRITKRKSKKRTKRVYYRTLK
jgi:hypothetical protein